MADKIPKLGSYPKGISEVYEMIKDPESVRETTRIANLKRAIERGTESTVVRSAGYNKLFETFIKKGISRATINAFKSIPDIADFDDAKSYSDALRKFRNTAFKGLSNKQLAVVESSGFLSQYAKDQRNKLLKSGLKNVKPNLNKILDQLFDYTFITKESAVGVAKPKLQSKIYTQIRDMAKRTLNKAQRLNLDYALSQVDDLFKSGKVAKAAKMLAGISTLVAKGVFGKVLGGPIPIITTPMGEEWKFDPELDPGKEPTIMEQMESAQQKADEMGVQPVSGMDLLNKQGGGLMDINHMTRPVGYDDGGDVTLEEIMQDMQDSEGPGEPGIIDKIIGNISPVDPVFKAKEKIKDVGKSLLDKIKDFAKYGWGDKEDYMEIGGRQVDPDDPNFIRFIENNYMGEGESYTEGIENYREFIEGEGYRRGGIVSLNHMTRAL
jgi:hypothetical protein